jgi:hypothetical protein
LWPGVCDGGWPDWDTMHPFLVPRANKCGAEWQLMVSNGTGDGGLAREA